MYLPLEPWARNTLAVLLVYRRPLSSWDSDEAKREIIRLLKSESGEDNAHGLLTIAGFYWGSPSWRIGGLRRKTLTGAWIPLEDLERHIFDETPSTWNAATWAWALRVRLIMFPGLIMLWRFCVRAA
jgi:hypothetical protein